MPHLEIIPLIEHGDDLAEIDEGANRLLDGAELHTRCTALHPHAEVCCGREQGHSGKHSISICDTDRVYVWL